MRNSYDSIPPVFFSTHPVAAPPPPAAPTQWPALPTPVPARSPTVHCVFLASFDFSFPPFSCQCPPCENVKIWKMKKMRVCVSSPRTYMPHRFLSPKVQIFFSLFFCVPMFTFLPRIWSLGGQGPRGRDALCYVKPPLLIKVHLDYRWHIFLALRVGFYSGTGLQFTALSPSLSLQKWGGGFICEPFLGSEGRIFWRMDETKAQDLYSGVGFRKWKGWLCPLLLNPNTRQESVGHTALRFTQMCRSVGRIGPMPAARAPVPRPRPSAGQGSIAEGRSLPTRPNAWVLCIGAWRVCTKRDLHCILSLVCNSKTGNANFVSIFFRIRIFHLSRYPVSLLRP